MSEISERISRMIENDGNGEIKRTLRVAQSDVMMLLSEYMEVAKLDMAVEKQESGFKLKLDADVSRFYNVGRTEDSL